MKKEINLFFCGILRSFFLILFVILGTKNTILYGQILSGKITDQHNRPLNGVQVIILPSSKGTSTASDGRFVLQKSTKDTFLVVKYFGYREDTFEIASNQNEIILQLNEGVELGAVNIQSQRSAHNFSLLDPNNLETIHESEFRKAACCSLAESFQSGNTVDLAYSNAIIGNKEIQMLGLRGIYTQQLIENRPVFTGILNTFGYDFIPGTWLQEINIQKGAASALHGAQSMTGAINSELKSPSSDERIFANAYADYHGRFETNVHLNKSWNKEDHSGWYLHGSRHSGFRDHNSDGFYDDARSNLLNGMWKNTFLGHQWEGQINAQGLINERTGGQNSENKLFTFYQKIKHLNLSGNLGYVGFDDAQQSTGSIYDISYSDLSGVYGKNKLYASEKHFLAQWIYKHGFKENKHEITVGPALNFNHGMENVSIDTNNFNLDYKEITPGLVGEYNFRFGKRSCEDQSIFVLSTSQRLDYIKLKHWFWAPRISLRYNINEEWTSRFSAGRGYRYYRLASDNINLLSTNRAWLIQSLPDYESSWNYGFNLVGKPYLFNKETECNLDAYLTRFDHQLVVDQDSDLPSQPLVQFYKLLGQSRAYSLSASYKVQVLERLSIKVGVRYQDNKIQLQSGFREQTMIANWRGLLSTDLNLFRNKIQWNVTAHYVGKMRFPDKSYYPSQLTKNHNGYSTPYVTLQTQINFSINRWELYLGCENISNYTQHHAILSSTNPLSPYFAANEIFAPINGIKPYLGVKYRIPSL